MAKSGKIERHTITSGNIFQKRYKLKLFVFLVFFFLCLSCLILLSVSTYPMLLLVFFSFSSLSYILKVRICIVCLNGIWFCKVYRQTHKRKRRSETIHFTRIPVTTMTMTTMGSAEHCNQENKCN